MTQLSHNLLMLVLLAVALATLWRVTRVRFRVQAAEAVTTNAPLLWAGGLGAMLGVAATLSVLTYPGSLFGMASLAAWTLFLHLPLYLLGVALLLGARYRWLGWLCGGSSLLLILVALDAFLIEPRWLQASTFTLSSPKLTEPVRVVLIADLQTDKPGTYEARALRRAMAAQPDLLLFAGDYIQLGDRSQGYVEEVQALNAILREAHLHAPLGMYAIQGNVDEYGLWQEVFAGLPVTATEEQTTRELGPLKLTLLGLWPSFSKDVVIPADEQFHIVMGHSPNFALGAVEGDLLLAGHTHGGQVRLPLLGPVMTLSAVPRSWAAGLTPLEPGRWLLVSRGVGMERGHAPRLRFLCRPQLVIIDLVPE